MEAEFTGAQVVMGDSTWNFAINYVDDNKATSTSEAVSNGIWSEILRRNFPHPKFIIAPEQRQSSGKRPDLTIFFVDATNKEWHPVFTFEGKAPYYIEKQSVIDSGITQAAGYVPSLSWSNHIEKWEKKKNTYGMLACGKSYMILECDIVTQEISRYDNPSKPKISGFTASSLDHDAKSFDDFCKKHANSFK